MSQVAPTTSRRSPPAVDEEAAHQERRLALHRVEAGARHHDLPLDRHAGGAGGEQQRREGERAGRVASYSAA